MELQVRALASKAKFTALERHWKAKSHTGILLSQIPTQTITWMPQASQ